MMERSIEETWRKGNSNGHGDGRGGSWIRGIDVEGLGIAEVEPLKVKKEL